MIRKIVETKGIKLWIEPDTGDLWVDLDIESKKIPSEDATELLIELRKQQLDYLQKNQDHEENLITKLLKSLWR